MANFFDELLGPSMPPHGHCYLWNDRLVGLHVGSDSLIVLAYFTIPLALIYLVRKRDDLTFNYIFYLFGTFIFACGATHLMAIWNVWHGAYWLSGYVKLVTAVASVLTAILVWPLIPRALAIPSNSALRLLNEKLQSEVDTNSTQRQELEKLSAQLDQKVRERTSELERAKIELENRLEERDRINAELNRTLQQLKETQSQLVESEKMASLGELVAGIAHEINTPLGVGVTAASTASSTAEAAYEEYQQGKLTNSGLKRYFERLQQSCGIILANLSRAAELIQSFKQVAVDQSSTERRTFNVKHYLEEILLSLHPILKKSRVEVTVDCDESIELCSYPGSFSQIVTNLVTNVLTHAYSPEEEGSLVIRVAPKDSGIILQVSDAGRGMPPESVNRIFDPFFTTRRGTGGSGLGMHIVYNLTTRQLDGNIHVDSEPGHGTTVEVMIPSKKESTSTLEA